jgi:hypothetical protein
MSQLQSLRAQSVRAAQSPRLVKRPPVESTSFDLALAQALTGKQSPEGSPPQQTAASSRSAGSEQEAAAPHRATGADAPAPDMQQEESKPGDSRTTGVSAQSETRPETETASEAGSESADVPRTESAPASPRLDAVRMESRSGSRPQQSGIAGSVSSMDASSTTEGSATGPARVDGDVKTTGTPKAAESAQPRERAAAAQESGEPAPASAGEATRMTIRFAGEDGRSGRLRLSVRGQTLHATIVSSDDDAVRRWSGDLDALHRSLANQGFSDARVTVRKTPTPESALPWRQDPDDPTRDESAREGFANPGRDRSDTDRFGRK